MLSILYTYKTLKWLGGGSISVKKYFKIITSD